MSGPDIFENSTTITVSVGGYNGISEEYGGVSAVVMTVNYDSTKISVTPTALNGFTLTAGPRLLLDRATGVSAGTAILSLNISNVGLAAGESTTISISGISGSDGEINTTAPSTSKTISRKVNSSVPEPSPTPTPTSDTPTGTTTPSSSTSANTSSDTAEKEVDSEKELENTEDIEEKIDNSTKNNSSPNKNKNKNKNKEKVVSITTSEDSDDSINPLIWIIPVVSLIALIMGLIFLFIFLKKRRKMNDQDIY